ncbi:dTDP-4-dehydrorhamnose 3,5-epimerase [Streptomyces vietnamensis]|uniref:dTDP-4-dehydrorhamnose 3,5-epimerase n=1 Tax=Streptomyces vietnamensis TaxID=362257 RepID=UPI00379BB191
MRRMSMDGVWLSTPDVHPDSRGTFHEAFRQDTFTEAVGHPFSLAQANVSVSRRGVLRGIHFAAVPPGQAKFVSCLHGAVLDVAVDLRVGSPTFGSYTAHELSSRNGASLYVAEGMGHAFIALTDEATVMYLCSAVYTPHREHTLDPFDPTLGIDWPHDLAPVLSPRDREAPSLAQLASDNVLPSYESCLAHARVRRA